MTLCAPTTPQANPQPLAAYESSRVTACTPDPANRVGDSRHSYRQMLDMVAPDEACFFCSMGELSKGVNA